MCCCWHPSTNTPWTGRHGWKIRLEGCPGRWTELVHVQRLPALLQDANYTTLTVTRCSITTTLSHRGPERARKADLPGNMTKVLQKYFCCKQVFYGSLAKWLFLTATTQTTAGMVVFYMLIITQMCTKMRVLIHYWAWTSQLCSFAPEVGETFLKVCVWVRNVYSSWPIVALAVLRGVESHPRTSKWLSFTPSYRLGAGLESFPFSLHFAPFFHFTLWSLRPYEYLFHLHISGLKVKY